MDIVERLRIRIHTSEDETALTNEAADEIERLREDLIEAEKYNGYHQQACLEIERLREALNGAYIERNRVVALLASVFPSGLKRTSIPDWDEEWNGCVYIDLPTGQASWHFHDCEAHLFSHLPPYEKDWDGHTTEEKYDRVSRSALQQKESKMITTTLNRIHVHSPSQNGWENLLKGLGKTKADDEPLTFAQILEINGLNEALWCLRAEPQYAKKWRLLAVAYARRVQHLNPDPRVKNAIYVAERYANGQATDEGLKAAWDAAVDAAWDAEHEWLKQEFLRVVTETEAKGG